LSEQKLAQLTMGVLKCPASFLPVRLLPQRGMAWGVGFVIHGEYTWQEIAGQGHRVTIK
jgi:hypothetical protein